MKKVKYFLLLFGMPFITIIVLSLPAPLGAKSGYSQIAAGFSHTCALTSGGAVHCWGHNDNGQLGNGSITNSSTPVPVIGLPSDVSAISAGFSHTCALTSSGAIHCWGYNLSGQLGNGSITNSSTPVPVVGLSSGISAIATGGSYTCILTSSGAVHCWGENWFGQLGDGSTVNSRTPVPVVGLTSGVSVISTGSAHTCALTASGDTYCWGYNGNGQLGDSSTIHSSIPISIAGLSSGVSAIDTGHKHTCVLTSSGAVHCWGLNDNGQLGNESTTYSSTPVPVVGLPTDVSAIATGHKHACALTSSSTVYCWGLNDNGQLGNMPTAYSRIPVPVMGLPSGVLAISAGGNHTCALTSGATAHCWGLNDNGQLGDGSITNSNLPVPVVSICLSNKIYLPIIIR